MIDGSILIGGSAVQREPKFPALNPATGQPTGQSFSEATVEDVAAACALAAAAVLPYSTRPPAERAAFLEAVAGEIEALGDALIEVAMAESGLPRPRLEGERGRTTGQLRLFAAEVRRGSWLDATIDPALPDRVPPRSDLRRVNLPLGPVAVFGASNFPLAFSVAGGDTAAALAAGCPVVVKGHPAHPGTGELVARAVSRAVATCGLPAGTFSYLPGCAHALGEALVCDPRIKAVGFTGSRSGGLALAALAARRPEPIPVYAEMSSVNPVVLLPAALEARAEALGQGFAASLTLGAGQFCTNPGLVIGLDSPALDRFLDAAAAEVGAVVAPVMLSAGIHAAYRAGVAVLVSHPAATCVVAGAQAVEPNRCAPALFQTTAAAFMADPVLGHEIFGAVSLVVRCQDAAELAAVIAALEGQLTATLHLDPADQHDAAMLLPLLQAKAGRVLANGWPTGVEVTRAMVHGGPYPATTDGRSTSVGTLAMARFLRPVCFQDMPEALLPAAVQSANPWGVPQSCG